MSTGTRDREKVGSILLEVARATLEHSFDLGPLPHPEETWLNDKGACFVTLHKSGALRGCIGSTVAYRPLVEDLVENTLAAAFRDPRFPPLRSEEMVETTLEVSLLEPLEAITFKNEQDLIRQLRPKVDGLMLESGSRRGLFLPAVWDGLPQAEEFVRKLKRKAGLEEDFWSSDLCAWRFTVSSWSESEQAE